MVLVTVASEAQKAKIFGSLRHLVGRKLQGVSFADDLMKEDRQLQDVLLLKRRDLLKAEGAAKPEKVRVTVVHGRPVLVAKQAGQDGPAAWTEHYPEREGSGDWDGKKWASYTWKTRSAPKQAAPRVH
jgi:hypothetical protein